MIHFAGLKAVGESVAHPQMYYENNVAGTMNLYSAMTKYGCKKVSTIHLHDHLIDSIPMHASITEINKPTRR